MEALIRKEQLFCRKDNKGERGISSFLMTESLSTKEDYDRFLMKQKGEGYLPIGLSIPILKKLLYHFVVAKNFSFYYVECPGYISLEEEMMNHLFQKGGGKDHLKEIFDIMDVFLKKEHPTSKKDPMFGIETIGIKNEEQLIFFKSNGEIHFHSIRECYFSEEICKMIEEIIC